VPHKTADLVDRRCARSADVLARRLAVACSFLAVLHSRHPVARRVTPGVAMFARDVRSCNAMAHTRAEVAFSGQPIPLVGKAVSLVAVHRRHYRERGRIHKHVPGTQYLRSVALCASCRSRRPTPLFRLQTRIALCPAAA
jgi:hypothetical protein